MPSRRGLPAQQRRGTTVRLVENSIFYFHSAARIPPPALMQPPISMWTRARGESSKLWWGSGIDKTQVCSQMLLAGTDPPVSSSGPRRRAPSTNSGHRSATAVRPRGGGADDDQCSSSGLIEPYDRPPPNGRTHGPSRLSMRTLPKIRCDLRRRRAFCDARRLHRFRRSAAEQARR